MDFALASGWERGAYRAGEEEDGFGGAHVNPWGARESQDFALQLVRLGVREKGRVHSPEISWPVASICTGSCMDACVLDAVSWAFGQEGMRVGFRTTHFYEIDEHKNKWCREVHAHLGEVESPCAFGNVAENGEDLPMKCFEHTEGSGKCTPPAQISGLIGGTSCKDFSRNNVKRLDKGDVARSSSSPGGSSQTLRGFMCELSARCPEWFIWENVDELNSGDQAGLDEVRRQMADKGYDCQPLVVDSSQYGLPQKRIRLFIVGLLRPARTLIIPSYSGFFSSFTELMGKFRGQGPSVVDILLPDDDLAVRRVLEARKPDTKQMESDTIQKHMVAWRKIGKVFQKDGASAADLRSPWWATLNARDRDMVAFSQHSNQGNEPADQVARSGVDVANSIGWSKGCLTLGEQGQLVLPTVMPGGSTWLSLEPGAPPGNTRSVHRLVIGLENMLAQGWPVLDPRFRSLTLEGNRDNKFFQSLGGNAFPGTVVAALLIAMVFAMDVRAGGAGRAVVTDGADAERAADFLRKRRRGP